MTVPQLLAAVDDAGFVVVIRDGKPAVAARKTGACLPPAILAELKARKAEVVEELLRPTSCPKCAASVVLVFRKDIGKLCIESKCPYRAR